MAFIVQEGQVRALQRSVAPAPFSLQLTEDLTQDYDHIWKTQPAVRTCVDFLARNIADLGLHLYRRRPDDSRERVRPDDHPAAALIAQPNPWTTPYRFKDALVHDLGIYDVSYALKLAPDGSGRPAALVRVPPKHISPDDKGSWLTPGGFIIRGAKGERPVPNEAVLHLHGYHPDSARLGVSPIEALRQMLITEFEASRMREGSLRNGARFSGYIKRPPMSPWGPGAKDRFKAQWQAQYAGSGGQVGGTPILEDGMEWVPASMTAEQLQYVESRKLSREEAAAAYFIPPPMIGLLDHATFSNITEQHKMLYSDTLGPWLTMITEELDLQLLRDFPTDSDGLYHEFNLREKLKGSFVEELQALGTAVGGPIMLQNEARSRINLPAVEGGDEMITQANIEGTPQESSSTEEEQQEPPAERSRIPARKDGMLRIKAAPTSREQERAVEVLQKFYRRQREAVLAKLGSKAGPTWWDGERWDRELTAELLRVSTSTATASAERTLLQAGRDVEDFDATRAMPYLAAKSMGAAEALNAHTKAALVEAVEDDGKDPAHVFDVLLASGAAQTALSFTTSCAAFGSHEAGVQTGASSKTWDTGSRPRSTHARLAGETVGVDSTFSNGMSWPGDSSNPDEVAGCNCTISINYGGNS